MKSLFYIFLMLPLGIFAQKFDNVWLGGLNEYPGSPLNGNYMIRFDSGVPVVSPADLNANFESTVAALSDSSGQLRLYTNGCSIYGASGEVILDGDDLNPGIVRDMVCPGTGYISPRGAMFLPYPDGSPYTYLFHMGMHYEANRSLTYGPLYMTIISELSGTPRAIYKNEVMLDDILAGPFNTRTFEPFSVVRHGNGRDWWLVVPEYGRNIYHTFLITSSSFFEQPVQVVGEKMKCKRIGSTVFSPDGTKFARQQNCGVAVMDFDRCTGKFSNPVWMPRPHYTFGGGGLAFSKDGTELLTNEYLTILKADLTQATPAFDTLVYPEDVIRTSLHYFQRGPDDQIYFSTLQRNDYMPVLRDGFDDSPVFEREGLSLPAYSVRNLPNFPNFRLYDFANSPCDTLGINSPSDVSVVPPDKKSFTLSPNPAATHFTVTLPEGSGAVRLSILDLQGRMLREAAVTASGQHIGTEGLPNGTYLVRISDAATGHAATQKLVLLR
jgi:hypothetical protein